MEIPKWKSITIETKILLLIVLGISIVMAGTTYMITSTVTIQEEELAYSQSIETARSYANQFDVDMQSSMSMAIVIANTMERYEGKSRDEVNSILMHILEENPELIGTYVCFEPNAFDGKDADFVNSAGHDETGRFIPYWNKLEGNIRLDPLLDYETSDYYKLPKERKENVVTEPYLYEGVLIVSYVSPIINNATFEGIGGVDLSLNYIDGIVSDIKIFDTGYALAVSNTGIIMSHPTEKDWIGTKTIDEFDSPGISEMKMNILYGKEGYLDTLDPTTGKEVVMFYQPVKTGNFSMVLVVPKEEMLAGVQLLRHQLMAISALAVVLMSGIGFLIGRSISRPIGRIISDFKDIADDAIKGNSINKANTDVDIDFKRIPEGLNEILEALQKTNASRERLEKVIKRSPALVFEWEATESWPVKYVSPNVSNIGYTPEDFLSGGLDYAAIIHKDDVKNVHKGLDRNIALNMDEFTQEYRIKTKSGDIRWVDERTTIMRDENGKVKSLQGIIVDIDERKEAEKALIEAKMIAEAANETKSQFLANMSHELRTPLNSIIGFSDILIDGVLGELNDKQNRYANNIANSGKHLLEIINEILDLSKVEAGKMELSPEKFEMWELLKELNNTIEPFATKKNIEMSLVLPEESVKLYADRIKVKQVLYNLLSNAVKFTPNDGKVGVEVHAKSRMAIITVFDTGIGISRDDISKLFQPFKQLDSTTSRKYEGTGLGLALVKKFVEMHGGKIWVESEPEKGSRFTFTIPSWEYE